VPASGGLLLGFRDTPSVPWYKVYSFLWKILKYKVHGEIVGFFTQFRSKYD
jgi:hypothetical protein